MATVQSWGTGRKDYSENIEYSTIPIIRSHQRRKVSTISNYVYYSFDWAYVSATPINTSQYDTDYMATGGNPDLYNLNTGKIYAEANGNWWIMISWVRYENYGSYVGGANPIAYYGSAYGYGKAELKWINPLFWDASKTYCDVVYWNIMMDNPYPSLPRGWPPDMYTINIQIHQLEDITAGPSY